MSPLYVVLQLIDHRIACTEPARFFHTRIQDNGFKIVRVNFSLVSFDADIAEAVPGKMRVECFFFAVLLVIPQQDTA